MFRLTIASAWSRKRRLAGTVVAIMLGVSFLSATSVLGDTARAGFATVFAEALDGTDAYVRSTQVFAPSTGGPGGGDQSFGGGRPPIDVAVADVVAAVDGVERVAIEAEGLGQIIDDDDQPIGGDGPPTMAWGWVDDPVLSPWVIVDGRAPRTAGEAVLDEGSVDELGIALGQPVTVAFPDPLEFTLVGVANFGEDTSIGGATFVGLELTQAQELFHGSTDAATGITVAAEDGIGQEEIASRISAVLPAGIEVITGDEFVQELRDDVESGFLGFFTMGLTIFAAVALVVAAFSIFNTFSILVAQRTRESALLRAIGASRRQVLASALTESLLVGVVGAVLGVGAGVALAAGALALAESAGLGLPTQGLEVTATAVTSGAIAGLVVTLVGGVVPAWRSSRTKPVAALREAAIDTSATSVVRAGIGAASLVIGLALVVIGGNGLTVPGTGAALFVLGIVLLGPIVARPMAMLIGSPVALSGTAGDLAQRNAIRNPRRTASTATALLVGIGVVSLFTVFGDSIKNSLEAEIAKTFAGDLAIQPAGGFTSAGLSPTLIAEIDGLDEVESVAGIGFGLALVDERRERVMYSNPGALAAVADFGVIDGDLGDLGTNDIAVNIDFAERRGYTVGDQVAVMFLNGAQETLTVRVVFDSSAMAGNITVNAELWLEHAQQPSFFFGLASIADGVSLEEAKEAVLAAGAGSGSPRVLDRQEFIESQAAEIDVLLTVIYVLLAIAIVIALMGIANTMSLSTYERIRELGLLRAVGLTRGQLRSTVRWESIIVATFGAVGGLGIGVFLSWGLVRALNQSQGFGEYSIPFGQLVVILFIGALVGLLAGLRPAWQAAKINVLDAIAEE